MQTIKAVWTEIIGLFVDDRLFSAAILVWLAVLWLLVRYASLAPLWQAITLFAGLALILVESATRAARR